MAFIVLALGAVMVVAGSYEVYFGNTYIVVERGWSAFISGTVLLTGGLITIALGLVMRALADLKAVLLIKHAPVAAAFPERATPAVASQASLPALAPDSPSLQQSDRAVLFDTPMPEPVAIPDAKGITGENSNADRASADVGRAIHEHDDGHPDANLHPAHPIAADLFQSEPLFDELRARPADGEARLSHELSPAMDDWLDRNFTDLARGTGAHPDAPPVETPSSPAALPEPVALAEIERPTAKPRQDETVSWRDRIMQRRTKTPAAPEPEPVREAERAPDAEHAEHPEEAEHRAAEYVDDSEQAAEVQSTQDAVRVPEPVPSPAVIGRYEAEGTSYVMYADGSIEAQSDAGIYRFTSMAELKTFIEG